MRSTLYLNQYEYNFCEDPYICCKNTIPILLHAYIMTFLCLSIYTLKPYDVISACFVLNMMRYDGHNMKANPLFMKLIFGYLNISSTFKILMAHDEQHFNVNILIDEDQTTSGKPQNTSKKIFKAICLLWSFSVSKSVSYNSAYLAVFCLSTLTELTTNFGLGV